MFIKISHFYREASQLTTFSLSTDQQKKELKNADKWSRIHAGSTMIGVIAIGFIVLNILCIKTNSSHLFIKTAMPFIAGLAFLGYVLDQIKNHREDVELIAQRAYETLYELHCNQCKKIG